MNKVYCIGSIFNKIEYLDKFISECDGSDTIYLLGNFSISCYQQTSQVTYLYLYNLVKQKEFDKDSKIPTIKLIKGKNEYENDLSKNQFSDFIINSNFQYLKNMNIVNHFDFNLDLPSTNELFAFINNLGLYDKLNNLVLISGYYDPNLDIDKQDKQVLLFDSPGYINAKYYEYCKTNKLRLWTKKSVDSYLKSNINYHGFKTIDEYNSKLKEIDLIVICGNFYDPNFKKDLNIAKWSNLYMLDGGINRSYNNEDKWFYFLPKDEKFNVLDITDTKNIKCISY